MMAETLTQRVRDRLRALADDGRFSQHQVAELLDMSQSNVSKTINLDSRPLTLEFLEAVSECAKTPIGELVAETGMLFELDAYEAMIIRALRAWPLTVRRALVDFLRFFADEEPVAGQTRKMHELYRHLDHRARLAVYGFAVQKSEGAIPPEIEAALFEELSSESKAAMEKPKKRRRDDRT